MSNITRRKNTSRCEEKYTIIVVKDSYNCTLTTRILGESREELLRFMNSIYKN